MSNKKEEMSEEEYLKRHLSEIDSSKNSQNSFNSDIPFSQPQPQVQSTRTFFTALFKFHIGLVGRGIGGGRSIWDPRLVLL